MLFSGKRMELEDYRNWADREIKVVYFSLM